jgi:hypothetical protein
VIAKLDRVRGTGVRGPLRSVGRVALWAVVVLLLVHGAKSVVSEPTPAASPSSGDTQASHSDAVDTFAVRYVRAYLAQPSAAGVQSLLAPGAEVPGGGESTETQVAQAEATATRALSDRRAVVTVWCELLTGRVVYLAVPTIRDDADGVAALGPPAFVSAPGIGRVEDTAERSQPIPGADAGEIRELAARFTETYLSATDPAGLKYLTAPAVTITPVGGFEVVGAVTVRQLGGGGGSSRTVLATVRAQDESGARFPVAYRLQVERRDRWYVAAVEGEVQ